jgi:hypothetical protein
MGLVRFGLVGLSKWVSLGCRSVTVRLRDAIEFVIFEEMSTLLVY